VIQVVRSDTSPPSLALRQSYRGDDVVKQLWIDGRGKCYLCERPVELGGFEVDHREPKDENPDELTYAWWNLYCCCDKCNGRRWRKTRLGGWLHPTTPLDGRLRQELRTGTDPRHDCYFAPMDPADLRAKNAAEELRHIHCEVHPDAADLRAAISRQLNQVLEAQMKLLLNKAGCITLTDVELYDLEEELRRLVSCSAPFTALMRSRVSPVFRHMFD